MLGGDLLEGIGRQVPGTFQGWRCGPGVVIVRCGECLGARGGVCAGSFVLLTSLLGSG